MATQIEGTIADGAAVGAQNPVTSGGVDYATGFAHRIQVNATGQQNVILAGSQSVAGTVANGAAGNPSPVVTGGLNGANVVSMIVDAAGRRIVVGAAAAGAAVAGNPILVGGTDGANARALLTDATGAQIVIQSAAANFLATTTQGPGNTANPWTVGGNVANNVADTGNPAKVGGVYQTVGALTALTVGSRGDLQLDLNGNVRSTMTLFAATGTDATANNLGFPLQTTSGSTAAQVKLSVASAKFNGATWDRDYKPRTAFRITSSTATNNAANIKTTPGTVLSISFNVTLAASTCYLKFFDTTGTPNPAALTPLYMFACNINEGFASVNLPAGGLYFPTGIGVALVANPADLDNTAIAAAQVTALNVSFQ